MIIEVIYEIIKCSAGYHNWKTVGFWRDRQDGEFQVECQSCRYQYWTNTPPDKNSLIEGISKF